MIEEQVRVLKAMSEITKRVDLNEFAAMVSLSPSQTMEYLKELINGGYVKSSATGYSVTNKGRAVLIAAMTVPEGMEFAFYTEVGQPTGLTAKSRLEFAEVAKEVAVASLEFHLHRGDFENWAKTTIRDDRFAEELARIAAAGSRGESLRKEIVAAAEAEFYS